MKVSIILPVYNVERYVKQCIKSVLAQTFRDFEIIIVDDCGTDRSMDIVKQTLTAAAWPEERLQIIHHPENKGLAAVRKTGILTARGEYILFIDSDDYISPLMTGRLVSMADRHGADIAMCGFVDERRPQNGTELATTLSDTEQEVSPTECLERAFGVWNQVFYIIWVNKLMRREFLLKHRLWTHPEYVLHEDFSVMCRAYHCTTRPVAVCTDRLYFYRRNECSLTETRTEKMDRYAPSLLAFLEELNGFMNAHYGTHTELLQKVQRFFFVQLVELVLYGPLPVLEQHRPLFRHIDMKWVRSNAGDYLPVARLMVLAWRYRLQPLLLVLRKAIEVRHRNRAKALRGG